MEPPRRPDEPWYVRHVRHLRTDPEEYVRTLETYRRVLGQNNATAYDLDARYVAILIALELHPDGEGSDSLRAEISVNRSEADAIAKFISDAKLLLLYAHMLDNTN